MIKSDRIDPDYYKIQYLQHEIEKYKKEAEKILDICGQNQCGCVIDSDCPKICPKFKE